jgi:hypothetical protein
MSDLPRYLPLSQRPRHDESGVTGDWAPRLAAVLEILAAVLDGEAPAVVRDDVARLAWRLRANRRARLGARLRRREPLSLSDDQSAVLRSIAADHGRRRALGDLAAAVVTTLDVADAAGRPVDIDSVTLGAVAVARALSAPLPIRAVLTGVTLVAAEGDWSVGRGPEHRAHGADIVRFLYGRTGLPPVVTQ